MKIRCKIAVAALIILGSIIGGFIFCNLTLFLSSNNFIESVTNSLGVLVKDEAPLSKANQIALDKLVRAGHVLTHSELLEVLSNFYNSIINNLIVVITLLGVVAYLSINSLSRRHAEQIAEETVQREFSVRLSDNDFVQKLLSSNDALASYIKDAEKITKFSELQEEREKLAKRVEALEYHLMSQGADEAPQANTNANKKNNNASQSVVSKKPMNRGKNRNGRNKKK